MNKTNILQRIINWNLLHPIREDSASPAHNSHIIVLLFPLTSTKENASYLNIYDGLKYTGEYCGGVRSQDTLPLIGNMCKD